MADPFIIAEIGRERTMDAPEKQKPENRNQKTEMGWWK